jgi:hypothetical protein
MAFVNAVAEEIADLRADNPFRICLEYLQREGRGRVNSKPFAEIQAELATHGIEMTREQFQQTLLKRTRGGDIFIGSTDHGPYRGYFLIVDEEDAEIAREFYCRRIHDQQLNLDRLEELMGAEFPNHQLIDYQY